MSSFNIAFGPPILAQANINDVLVWNRHYFCRGFWLWHLPTLCKSNVQWRNYQRTIILAQVSHFVYNEDGVRDKILQASRFHFLGWEEWQE